MMDGTRDDGTDNLGSDSHEAGGRGRRVSGNDRAHSDGGEGDSPPDHQTVVRVADDDLNWAARSTSPTGSSSVTSTEAVVPAEPTTVEKLAGLRWSIASNAANTVFVQYTFFGSIFVLFLSALGLSKTEMGFLLSLLPFFGLIALFVAPAVARFGYKRTYITFFGMRSVVAAGLLLTPLVLNQFGEQITLTFVASIVALFAMVRSVGVTASFPWAQEYVPDNVRGKYTATSNMFTTITGFAAVTIGGLVLRATTGLSGFMILIVIGVVFGLVSVALATSIPGGAPQPRQQDDHGRDLWTAIRDSDMVSYLLAVGLITLATVPLNSFLPLFMQEQVGLDASGVVWLQTGTLMGSLLSGYLWGWAADRYGSAPVTLYGLSLRAMLPLAWMLMPRNSEMSLYVALGIALCQGVADMGWGIGSGRMLYVSIVPRDKRSDYMALYYAWIGIVGGISQLSGGRILDLFQGFSGQLWIFRLDPFIPLFAAGVVLPFAGFFLLRRVQGEDVVGMSEFAGIFLRGNPFLAMSSMIRFHLARDEHATVMMTEALGQARSRLTVDELLEALEDPRFNVRFEAIISMSRMIPDARLINALEEMLTGSELALTVVAAWALGRLGDPQAIDPLRRGLDSEYRSIRAHCARALGALGATEVAEELLERLEVEEDKGLQMSYASALGNLSYQSAIPRLLVLLRKTENPGARMELALSVGRLIGHEHTFIQLVRTVRSDPGTAMAQSLAAFKRRVARALQTQDPKLVEMLDATTDHLARGEIEEGTRLASDLVRQLPDTCFSQAGAQVLHECADRLSEFDSERIEYIILTLHTLQVDWQG